MIRRHSLKPSRMPTILRCDAMSLSHSKSFGRRRLGWAVARCPQCCSASSIAALLARNRSSLPDGLAQSQALRVPPHAFFLHSAGF